MHNGELTWSPSGSTSVTFERGSAASAARVSSSIPPVAHCGVKVCQVQASRRGGSDSNTTCSGSAMTTPFSSHVTRYPFRHSESSRNSQ